MAPFPWFFTWLAAVAFLMPPVSARQPNSENSQTYTATTVHPLHTGIPPWMGVLWTQAAAAAALLATAAGAHQLRVRRLERSQTLLRAAVSRGADELARARQANVVQSALLDRMNRDLRPPLNALLGLSDLLRVHGSSPELRRDIAAIHRSSESLLGLLNQMLEPAHAENTPVQCSPGPPEVLGLEPGQPEYRVLVVENEPAYAAILERILRYAGFRVRVARTGSDGVDLCAAWHPHYIWMNLLLPGMDGVEAARRIRSMEPGRHVKIAGMTTSGNLARPDGIDDVIRKPFERAQIFECMARHLPLRYVYGTGPRHTPWPEPLSPEALAALPESCRADLVDAVVSLETARIEAAVARVSELDQELGRALARCAERYAYTEIFHALEASGCH